MKKLALGAVFIGLLAACGGGDDTMIDVIDAGEGPDASQACNPVSQTGCGVDEKCTWINIDSMNDVGTLGCVADGSVATLGACTFGPDGETTGFDNCEAGNICIYSVCEEICTDAPDSCGANTACSSYAGLFPDTSTYGACDFTCDPVDQTRDTDGLAACGSTQAIARACYANSDDTFSCTGVPGPAAALTQDDIAYGPMSGTAYVNGCAAGFAPLLRSMAVATAPPICLAFCRPQETHSANIAGLDGVPGSGFTCADRQAVVDNECRFYWFTMGTMAGPDQNDVGFCFRPIDYVGDLDNMPATPDTAYPGCDTLPNTDVAGDGDPDHYDWACAPFAATAGMPSTPKHPSPFTQLPEDAKKLRD